MVRSIKENVWISLSSSVVLVNILHILLQLTYNTCKASVIINRSSMIFHTISTKSKEPRGRIPCKGLEGIFVSFPSTIFSFRQTPTLKPLPEKGCPTCFGFTRLTCMTCLLLETRFMSSFKKICQEIWIKPSKSVLSWGFWVFGVWGKRGFGPWWLAQWVIIFP